MSFNRPRAHVPWSRIEEFLSEILELGLAPEVAFKGPDFDGLNQAQLDRTARQLQQSCDQRPTVHAPFFDLNPGALDPLIREVTMNRLSQALDVAGRLGACVMVVHPGYDRWRYPGLGQAWSDLAVDFFQPLIKQAAAIDCRLALENIYEETPETLRLLADGIDSPWFGHCFDIGHWNLFGTMPIDAWLPAIAPRLYHLHLHDNHGKADDHLPIGSASIDFKQFFTTLSKLPCQPSMTLEAHRLSDLKASLSHISTYR